MLERLRDFFRTKKIESPLRRQKYLERFFSAPFHQWINENKYYRRAFQVLIESFPSSVLDHFDQDRPIIFVQASGKYSCALSASLKYHIIVVFPDLCQMLKSGAPTRGMAILAHELGHLFYNHSPQRISPLKAQMEADKFAFDLGFGHELQDILLDYPQSHDCQMRIEYLTLLLQQQTGLS